MKRFVIAIFMAALLTSSVNAEIYCYRYNNKYQDAYDKQQSYSCYFLIDTKEKTIALYDESTDKTTAYRYKGNLNKKGIKVGNLYTIRLENENDLSSIIVTPIEKKAKQASFAKTKDIFGIDLAALTPTPTPEPTPTFTPAPTPEPEPIQEANIPTADGKEWDYAYVISHDNNKSFWCIMIDEDTKTLAEFNTWDQTRTMSFYRGDLNSGIEWPVSDDPYNDGAFTAYWTIADNPFFLSYTSPAIRALEQEPDIYQWLEVETVKKDWT